MKIKQNILSVLYALVWVGASEFVRNQLIFKSYWVDHYASLGLTFPQKPLNGAMWGLWSLCFVGVVYVLAKKFTLRQTVLLSWFMGFVLMWIVIGNLGVLPGKLLFFAVPLSVLEALGATWIMKKPGKMS